MNNRVLDERQQEGALLASFGEAQLVKVDGRLELRGGTMSDRMEALEWISLFLPEEVARVRRDL